MKTCQKKLKKWRCVNWFDNYFVLNTEHEIIKEFFHCFQLLLSRNKKLQWFVIHHHSPVRYSSCEQLRKSFNAYGNRLSSKLIIKLLKNFVEASICGKTVSAC